MGVYTLRRRDVRSLYNRKGGDRCPPSWLLRRRPSICARVMCWSTSTDHRQRRPRCRSCATISHSCGGRPEEIFQVAASVRGTTGKSALRMRVRRRPSMDSSLVNRQRSGESSMSECCRGNPALWSLQNEHSAFSTFILLLMERYAISYTV